MAGSSSLGANITADAINNFFTLKPLSTEQHKQQKSVLHRPGRVLQQLMVAGKTAERRRSSGSNDNYTVLSDPSSSRNNDLLVDYYTACSDFNTVNFLRHLLLQEVYCLLGFTLPFRIVKGTICIYMYVY